MILFLIYFAFQSNFSVPD